MSNYKSDVVLIVADDEHVWFKIVHWPEAVLWRRLTADGAAPHHEGASTFWCRTLVRKSYQSARYAPQDYAIPQHERNE